MDVSGFSGQAVIATDALTTSAFHSFSNLTVTSSSLYTVLEILQPYAVIIASNIQLENLVFSPLESSVALAINACNSSFDSVAYSNSNGSLFVFNCTASNAHFNLSQANINNISITGSLLVLSSSRGGLNYIESSSINK